MLISLTSGNGLQYLRQPFPLFPSKKYEVALLFLNNKQLVHRPIYAHPMHPIILDYDRVIYAKNSSFHHTLTNLQE